MSRRSCSIRSGCQTSKISTMRSSALLFYASWLMLSSKAQTAPRNTSRRSSPTLRPQPEGTTSGKWHIKRQFNSPVCGSIRAPGLSFENNTDGENPLIADSGNVSIKALTVGQPADHSESSAPSRMRKAAVQLS